MRAIDGNHPKLSVSRQCELLGISRSGLSYIPKEREEDKRIMDEIDRIYTDLPFYGSRRIKWELLDRFGTDIGRDHIRRLMRMMGVEAIYPKPKTSLAHPEHEKFPYLLRGVPALYPNHIWGTDITYIPLETGWAYLVALIDWYSRYVLAWELSASMETAFCLSNLERALKIGIPLFHNSDQGVQFTDREYIAILKAQEIKISMDGRGRCMDNIFTERLWRTVKYENVYIHAYRDIPEARAGLGAFFPFYNETRRHQSLEGKTPHEVYFGKPAERKIEELKPPHVISPNPLTLSTEVV